jgi:hypothetical protein
MSHPRIPLVVLAAGLSVTVGAPGRAAAHVDRATDASRVRGNISYVTSACPGERKEPDVEGAKIVLERDGQRAEDALEFGNFDVKLGGNGPITAYVELTSAFATIKPFGVSHPYRIPVNVHAGKNDVLIRHNGQGAAANVATEIDHGARFAHATLPAGATLPPVTVRLRYTSNFSFDETAIGPSHYDPGTIEIDNNPKHPDYQGEWERFTILHEYGHHVLHSLTDPGERRGGDHAFEGVYPDRPALAWSEGFADAFPALLAGKPQLKRQCHLVADLAAAPATPISEDPVESDRAQYNEIQAAGVIWHLAILGGKSRYDRTRQLLTAARAFKARAGHYPESMREVRDALVGSPLEPDTVAGHDAIDKIFADHHMGWGVAVLIEDGDGSSYGQFLHLRLTGPYGTCEDLRLRGLPNPPHPIQGKPGEMWDGGLVNGALDTTWKDDCLISSGPVYDTLPGGLENHGSLGLVFPYLDRQRHASGTFSLYGTFICDKDLASPPCEGSFTYDVTLIRGWFLNRVGDPGANAPMDAGDGHHYFADLLLELREGVATEILRFDAQGGCEIVPLHEDCSV